MLFNPGGQFKKLIHDSQVRKLKHFQILIAGIIGISSILLIQCGSSIFPSENAQPLKLTETTSPTFTTQDSGFVTQKPTAVLKKTDTPTQIPRPTSTVISATPTLTPLITELTTPTLPTHRIPKYSSNLLYLSNDNLMRWDHVTNTVNLLTDNVYEYSVNSGGTVIAVLKKKNIVANGIQLYDLELLDLNSGQITPLKTSIPKIHNITISPDSKRIAYTPNFNGGRITSIKTGSPETVVELGFCHQLLDNPCDNISWSPDSKQLIWSDQRGVWINQLNGESPQLITQNQTSIVGPEGESTVIEVSFKDFSWSPSGRYVLATINPKTYLTKWSVIIDTRREIVIEIPGSFQLGNQSNNTTWLQDGSIIVGSGIETSEDGFPVIIQIFEIIPTQENLLQLSNTFQVSDDQLPDPITQSGNLVYLVDWIYQYGNNQINFGVFIGNDNSPVTLLSLMIDKYFINFIRHTPTTTDEILWAPDESGELIVDSDGSVLFADMGDGNISILNQILGSDLSNFYWLPPAPR